jgi:hypothetical protein
VSCRSLNRSVACSDTTPNTMGLIKQLFVDELEPDQTPETVALMPHDIIYVSHVISPEPIHPEAHSCQLADCLGLLLTDDINDLADITFRVGPDEEPIKAHKAILCARSSYFAAMFRPGGLVESTATEVRISEHSVMSFNKTLEFIYSSHVKTLKEDKFEDIFDIICLASEYMLEELQTLCEKTLMEAIDTDNVCSCFTFATKKFCSPVLQEFCQDFVVANIEKLRVDEKFRAMVAESPHLALILVDYVSGNHKKRKRNSADGLVTGGEEYDHDILSVTML